MDNFKKETHGFFPRNINREQAKDTGMAMVLICLLVSYFGESDKALALSFILLIMNMAVPMAYKPIATLWLGFSNILGTIMSKILLTILFFVLVTPIGIFRRIIGKDALKIRRWKKDTTSTFQFRDHLFTPEDIDKPY